jgi:hypothetical protein
LLNLNSLKNQIAAKHTLISANCPLLLYKYIHISETGDGLYFASGRRRPEILNVAQVTIQKNQPSNFLVRGHYSGKLCIDFVEI